MTTIETTILVIDDSTTLLVENASVDVVSVADQGPPGAIGLKGDKGDQGEPGKNGVDGNGYTFVFEQSASSASWIVEHNLNKFPSVTVIDSAGDQCIGRVSYSTANTVTIDFSAPFSGTAYLN